MSRSPNTSRVSSSSSSSPSSSSSSPLNCLTGYYDITIVEAKGVKAADIIGTSDPYVDIYARNHERTNVVQKTLNPVWNYRLKDPLNNPLSFNPARPSLDKIKFVVWDEDKLAKDDYLGEAVYNFPTSVTHEEVIRPSLKLIAGSEHQKEKKITGTLYLTIKVSNPMQQYHGVSWLLDGAADLTQVQVKSNSEYPLKWGANVLSSMNNGVISFIFSEFWRTYIHEGKEYRAEVKGSVKMESDVNHERICNLKVMDVPDFHASYKVESIDEADNKRDLLVVLTEKYLKGSFRACWILRKV